MTKSEENKLRKRNKILEAAYELFSSKGINMTAIDEVVKKAGVAKGTFYLYFRDKYDLMDQIVLHKSTLLVREVMESVQQHAQQEQLSAVDRVLLLLDKYIDEMIANRNILPLVSKRISDIYDLLNSEENAEFQNNMDEMARCFTDIGYSPARAKKQLYLLLNMFCSVSCDSILSGTPYVIEELRPEIHDMVRKLLS